MTIAIFLRLACAVAVAVSITAHRTSVQAQQRAGTAETDKIQPVNSGPNPYRVIRDWAQLTLEKRPWGGSNGVAVDRDGKSVWATDRCSPGICPGLPRHQGKPRPSLRRDREGDQELRRRHVRVATRHPRRS